MALGGVVAAATVGSGTAGATNQVVDGGTATTRDDTIRLRRGATTDWNGVVLDPGEPGLDTTAGDLRIGTGTEAWADLASVMRSRRGVEVANPGDLYMEVGAYAGGVIDAGTIRRVNGIRVKPPTYTQAVPPTDEVMGRWVGVEWNATLNPGPTIFDPAIGTNRGTNTVGPYGPFGPPGVFDLKGHVWYGVDQTAYAFSPIAFASVLAVSNTPGANRTLVPSWGFARAELFGAFGATVTLAANDTLPGGASFVDNEVFFTAGSGTLDGTTNQIGHHGFASLPFLVGNVHLAFRRGFYCSDVNFPIGTFRGTDDGSNPAGGSPSGVAGMSTDGYGSTIDWNIGLEIERMTRGERNIGIWNSSATVEAPHAETIGSAGTTLSVLQTLSTLDNTTGGPVTLTSVPTIAPGVDGQRLSLMTVSTHPVKIQDASVLTGSRLSLGTDTRTIPRGGVLTLVWSDALDAWTEVSASREVEAASTTSSPSTPTSRIAVVEHFLTPTPDAWLHSPSNGGGVTDASIAKLRPGVIRLSTGSSTNGGVITQCGNLIIRGDSRGTTELGVQVNTSSPGNTFGFRAGVVLGFTAGWAFGFDAGDANWCFYTGNGVTETKTTTTVARDALWHVVVMERTATDAVLRLDGTEIARVSTNLPGSTKFLNIKAWVASDSGTTAKSAYLDWVGVDHEVL